MALAHLTDLFDRAKLRMLLQYRGLTKFVADLGVLVAEVQELEDAFWSFNEELDVDNADGVWLDRLGTVIGEFREGEFDTQYRQYVKARILANKSKATSDEIIEVVTVAMDATPPTLTLVDWYPAAQALTITDPPMGGQVGDTQLNRVSRLIQRARAVAVNLQLLFQDDTDAEAFVCGDSGGLLVVGKGFDDESAPDDPTAGRLAGVVQA